MKKASKILLKVWSDASLASGYLWPFTLDSCCEEEMGHEFWVRLFHFHKSISLYRLRWCHFGTLLVKSVQMKLMSCCFTHPTGYHCLWKGEGYHIYSKYAIFWFIFACFIIYKSFDLFSLLCCLGLNDILLRVNCGLFHPQVPSVGVGVWWDPELQPWGASYPQCSARECRPSACVTWWSAGKAYLLLITIIIKSRTNEIEHTQKC